MATPTPQKNTLLIIGDSRLDLPHFIQQITTSPTAPTTFPHEYELITKYYQATIDVHCLSEVELLEYTLNPTSEKSSAINQILNNTHSCIVLFDANSEKLQNKTTTTNNNPLNNHNLAQSLPPLPGFGFIRSLYTSAIHDSISQRVDTHILLGVTQYSYVNGGGDDDDVEEEQQEQQQSQLPKSPTTFQLNDKIWNHLQNYALDYNMQLIIYDNYHPAVMSKLRYNDFEKKMNAALTGSAAVGSNAAGGGSGSDGEDGEDGVDDDFELDDSEIGHAAVFSALSCCQWPVMQRIEKGAKPIVKQKAEVVPEIKADAQAETTTTTTPQETEEPEQPSQQQQQQVGLLNSNTRHQQRQQNLQFGSFDDGFDFGYDDDEEFQGYQGLDDDLSGLAGPNSDETTPPTTNDTDTALLTTEQEDFVQQAAQREQLKQLQSMENLFAQMSTFSSNVKQGKVKNDKQRRDQATMYALMLASMLGLDQEEGDDEEGDMQQDNTSEQPPQTADPTQSTTTTSPSKQTAPAKNKAKPTTHTTITKPQKQKKNLFLDDNIDDPFFQLFGGMNDEDNMDLADLDKLFGSIDEMNAPPGVGGPKPQQKQQAKKPTTTAKPSANNNAKKAAPKGKANTTNTKPQNKPKQTGASFEPQSGAQWGKQ